jgi:transaldolase
VRCPLTRAGIKATSALSRDSIRVNATFCFSAAQAIIAAKAAAYIISSFVVRLDDIGFSGIALIRSITQICRHHGYATQVLAASLRPPTHVVDSALAPSHLGAMPFKVMAMLFNHPRTDKVLQIEPAVR